MPPLTARPIARLWRLVWDEDHLSCVVYKVPDGRLEVHIESETKTILTEAFELRPRMLARMEALKHALQRRGWQDSFRA